MNDSKGDVPIETLVLSLQRENRSQKKELDMTRIKLDNFATQLQAEKNKCDDIIASSEREVRYLELKLQNTEYALRKYEQIKRDNNMPQTMESTTDFKRTVAECNHLKGQIVRLSEDVQGKAKLIVELKSELQLLKAKESSKAKLQTISAVKQFDREEENQERMKRTIAEYDQKLQDAEASFAEERELLVARAEELEKMLQQNDEAIKSAAKKAPKEKGGKNNNSANNNANAQNEAQLLYLQNELIGARQEKIALNKQIHELKMQVKDVKRENNDKLNIYQRYIMESNFKIMGLVHGITNIDSLLQEKSLQLTTMTENLQQLDAVMKILTTPKETLTEETQTDTIADSKTLETNSEDDLLAGDGEDDDNTEPVKLDIEVSPELIDHVDNDMEQSQAKNSATVSPKASGLEMNSSLEITRPIEESPRLTNSNDSSISLVVDTTHPSDIKPVDEDDDELVITTSAAELRKKRISLQEKKRRAYESSTFDLPSPPPDSTRPRGGSTDSVESIASVASASVASTNNLILRNIDDIVVKTIGPLSKLYRSHPTIDVKGTKKYILQALKAINQSIHDLVKNNTTAPLDSAKQMEAILMAVSNLTVKQMASNIEKLLHEISDLKKAAIQASIKEEDSPTAAEVVEGGRYNINTTASQSNDFASPMQSTMASPLMSSQSVLSPFHVPDFKSLLTPAPKPVMIDASTEMSDDEEEEDVEEEEERAVEYIPAVSMAVETSDQGLTNVTVETEISSPTIAANDTIITDPAMTTDQPTEVTEVTEVSKENGEEETDLITPLVNQPVVPPIILRQDSKAMRREKSSKTTPRLTRDKSSARRVNTESRATSTTLSMEDIDAITHHLELQMQLTTNPSTSTAVTGQEKEDSDSESEESDSEDESINSVNPRPFVIPSELLEREVENLSEEEDEDDTENTKAATSALAQAAAMFSNMDQQPPPQVTRKEKKKASVAVVPAVPAVSTRKTIMSINSSKHLSSRNQPERASVNGVISLPVITEKIHFVAKTAVVEEISLSTSKAPVTSKPSTAVATTTTATELPTIDEFTQMSPHPITPMVDIPIVSRPIVETCEMTTQCTILVDMTEVGCQTIPQPLVDYSDYSISINMNSLMTLRPDTSSTFPEAPTARNDDLDKLIDAMDENEQSAVTGDICVTDGSILVTDAVLVNVAEIEKNQGEDVIPVSKPSTANTRTASSNMSKSNLQKHIELVRGNEKVDISLSDLQHDNQSRRTSKATNLINPNAMISISKLELKKLAMHYYSEIYHNHFLFLFHNDKLSNELLSRLTTIEYHLQCNNYDNAILDKLKISFYHPGITQEKRMSYIRQHKKNLLIKALQIDRKMMINEVLERYSLLELSGYLHHAQQLYLKLKSLGMWKRLLILHKHHHRHHQLDFDDDDITVSSHGNELPDSADSNDDYRIHTANSSHPHHTHRTHTQQKQRRKGKKIDSLIVSITSKTKNKDPLSPSLLPSSAKYPADLPIQVDILYIHIQMLEKCIQLGGGWPRVTLMLKEHAHSMNMNDVSYLPEHVQVEILQHYREAVFTQGLKWKTAYNDILDELQQVIKDSKNNQSFLSTKVENLTVELANERRTKLLRESILLDAHNAEKRALMSPKIEIETCSSFTQTNIIDSNGVINQLLQRPLSSTTTVGVDSYYISEYAQVRDIIITNPYNYENIQSNKQLPPGFIFVRVKDESLLLSENITLAIPQLLIEDIDLRHSIPENVIYIRKKYKSAVLPWYLRAMSYMEAESLNIPTISECQPVYLLKPIVEIELATKKKIKIALSMKYIFQFVFPWDIYCIQYPDLTILDPMILLPVKVSLLPLVPKEQLNIHFGRNQMIDYERHLHYVQVHTDMILPDGFPLTNTITVAKPPPTVQLPSTIQIIQSAAMFDERDLPLYVTLLKSKYQNDISDLGCSICEKPKNVKFGLGQEILYRPPWFAYPIEGISPVPEKDYPNGLILQPYQELIQLIPRYDLPTTFRPHPLWRIYHRPYEISLPPAVYLLEFMGDEFDDAESLPMSIVPIQLPMPPSLPKNIIVCEFLKDAGYPLPYGSELAKGIYVVSIVDAVAKGTKLPSLALNEIPVYRIPGGNLPDAVEVVPMSHFGGIYFNPNIEIVTIPIRFELPCNVSVQSNASLGKYTQLSPRLTLGNNLDILPWPAGVILPANIQLARLPDYCPLPYGYKQVSIAPYDPYKIGLPSNSITIELMENNIPGNSSRNYDDITLVDIKKYLYDIDDIPEIANMKYPQETDESFIVRLFNELIVPESYVFIKIANKSVKHLPNELNLIPIHQLTNTLRAIIEIANHNLRKAKRFNNNQMLQNLMFSSIHVVSITPYYSYPAGIELVEDIFVQPSVPWLFLPSSVSLVSPFEDSQQLERLTEVEREERYKQFLEDPFIKENRLSMKYYEDLIQYSLSSQYQQEEQQSPQQLSDPSLPDGVQEGNDIPVSACLSSSSCQLPPYCVLVRIPETLFIHSWRKYAPNLHSVSSSLMNKSDHKKYFLPPAHFLVEKSRQAMYQDEDLPYDLLSGVDEKYQDILRPIITLHGEKKSLLSLLPPGIEIVHLRPIYYLPRGIAIENIDAITFYSTQYFTVMAVGKQHEKVRPYMPPQLALGQPISTSHITVGLSRRYCRYSDQFTGKDTTGYELLTFSVSHPSLSPRSLSAVNSSGNSPIVFSNGKYELIANSQDLITSAITRNGIEAMKLIKVQTIDYKKLNHVTLNLPDDDLSSQEVIHPYYLPQSVFTTQNSNALTLFPSKSEWYPFVATDGIAAPLTSAPASFDYEIFKPTSAPIVRHPSVAETQELALIRNISVQVHREEQQQLQQLQQQQRTGEEETGDDGEVVEVVADEDLLDLLPRISSTQSIIMNMEDTEEYKQMQEEIKSLKLQLERSKISSPSSSFFSTAAAVPLTPSEAKQELALKESSAVKQLQEIMKQNASLLTELTELKQNYLEMENIDKFLQEQKMSLCFIYQELSKVLSEKMMSFHTSLVMFYPITKTIVSEEIIDIMTDCDSKPNTALPPSSIGIRSPLPSFPAMDDFSLVSGDDNRSISSKKSLHKPSKASFISGLASKNKKGAILPPLSSSMAAGNSGPGSGEGFQVVSMASKILASPIRPTKQPLANILSNSSLPSSAGVAMVTAESDRLVPPTTSISTASSSVPIAVLANNKNRRPSIEEIASSGGDIIKQFENYLADFMQQTHLFDNEMTVADMLAVNPADMTSLFDMYVEKIQSYLSNWFDAIHQRIRESVESQTQQYIQHIKQLHLEMECINSQYQLQRKQYKQLESDYLEKTHLLDMYYSDQSGVIIKSVGSRAQTTDSHLSSASSNRISTAASSYSTTVGTAAVGDLLGKNIISVEAYHQLRKELSSLEAIVDKMRQDSLDTTVNQLQKRLQRYDELNRLKISQSFQLMKLQSRLYLLLQQQNQGEDEEEISLLSETSIKKTMERGQSHYEMKLKKLIDQLQSRANIVDQEMSMMLNIIYQDYLEYEQKLRNLIPPKLLIKIRRIVPNDEIQQYQTENQLNYEQNQYILDQQGMIMEHHDGEDDSIYSIHSNNQIVENDRPKLLIPSHLQPYRKKHLSLLSSFSAGSASEKSSTHGNSSFVGVQSIGIGGSTVSTVKSLRDAKIQAKIFDTRKFK